LWNACHVAVLDLLIFVGLIGFASALMLVSRYAVAAVPISGPNTFHSRSVRAPSSTRALPAIAAARRWKEMRTRSSAVLFGTPSRNGSSASRYPAKARRRPLKPILIQDGIPRAAVRRDPVESFVAGEGFACGPDKCPNESRTSFKPCLISSSLAARITASQRAKEFYRVAMQVWECIPSTNQVPPLPLNPMRKTWLPGTVTNGGT
jgi:hypothetical protein